MTVYRVHELRQLQLVLGAHLLQKKRLDSAFEGSHAEDLRTYFQFVKQLLEEHNLHAQAVELDLTFRIKIYFVSRGSQVVSALRHRLRIGNYPLTAFAEFKQR